MMFLVIPLFCSQCDNCSSAEDMRDTEDTLPQYVLILRLSHPP